MSNYDAIMWMFTRTDPSSLGAIEKMREQYKNSTKTYLPQVICDNKTDIKVKLVNNRDVHVHEDPDMATEYYQISCVSNYHITRPTNYLSRVLSGCREKVTPKQFASLEFSP